MRAESARTGWPVVSVVIDEQDLHSKETGIARNYMERGEPWERPALATLYEQGAAVLELNAVPPRWRWVNWDMDRSLGVTRWDKGIPAWRERAFRLILRGGPWWTPRPKERMDLRYLLFTRLLQECPEYRAYFAGLVNRILDEELTPAFIESRIAHYSRLAVAVDTSERGIVSFNRMAEFLRNRPAFIREDLGACLAAIEAGLPGQQDVQEESGQGQHHVIQDAQREQAEDDDEAEAPQA